MTRDDLIKMAREADFCVNEDGGISTSNSYGIIRGELEHFAALVAAAEREACALICDEHADDPVYCGEAIRARRHNMTDEELKQAIEELNDTKAEQLTDEEFAGLAEVYGKKETEQDIATLEKNIALMRDEELRVCVKEFFEKYLNRTEESDGGREFSPITVSCCRALMLEPLNKLLERMAELSGAAPKVTYNLQGE